MISVPDACSVAAMRRVRRVLGRRVGGSTGTNLLGCVRAAAEMRASRGDRAHRHADLRRRRALLNTYYSDDWADEQGFDLTRAQAVLARVVEDGEWDD